MAGIEFTPAQAASVGLGQDSGGSALGTAIGLASMATPYGWVSAGLSLLGGGGGMFGKSDNSTSGAYSGFGGFSPDLRVDSSYKKPMLDFDNPLHVLALAGLVLGGVYAWKRVK